MSGTPRKGPDKPPGHEPKTIRAAIIELLKVKSIITIVIIAIVSVLAVKGIEIPNVYVAISSSVVTYYFTRPKED